MEIHLHHAVAELDARVAEGFLFGEAPSIADFSVYHCLWFVGNNEINAPLLDGYPRVQGWMSHMAAFGHGAVTESTGEAALAAWSVDEIVLERETPETGAVMTHFPAPGFEVKPAS